MKELNVLGTPLQACCYEPRTGFFRDGFCRTAHEDLGRHTVCVVMTDRFLAFSKARGNDLSTPHPEWQFPGLRAGDRWCLCAARWREAWQAGEAPGVILEATHEATLAVVSRSVLEEHAMPLESEPENG